MLSGVKGAGLPYETPVTYAQLTAYLSCSTNAAGARARVKDSMTQAAGAVITGGGSYFVPAVCSGTAWVVDGAGSGGGVTSIIPGTDVTCTPDVSGSCMGAVTVSATGGSHVGVNGGSTIASPDFNSTTPAAPSGNQNCTFQQSGSSISCYVPTSSSANTYYFSFVACDPGAGGNINHCTGTASLPTAFADTSYQLVCTDFTTGGANTFFTVTSKLTDRFNFDVAVMMVDGTSSQPTTVDCVAHHN